MRHIFQNNYQNNTMMMMLEMLHNNMAANRVHKIFRKVLSFVYVSKYMHLFQNNTIPKYLKIMRHI